jgi:hypothetical protein
MTYSEREFGASQSDYEPKEQQMSDIMERLRLQGQAGLCPVCLEAADYIERLRAGRAAVEEWNYDMDAFPLDGAHYVILCTRLDEKPIAWQPYTMPRALKGGAA